MAEVLFYDDFHRANQSGLGNDWLNYNLMDISGNKAVSNSGWNGATVIQHAPGTEATDVYISAIFHTIGTQHYQGLIFRNLDTSGFGFVANSGGSIYHFGNWNLLASGFNGAGDHLVTSRYIGATHTLEIYLDGELFMENAERYSGVWDGNGVGICGDGEGTTDYQLSMFAVTDFLPTSQQDILDVINGGAEVTALASRKSLLGVGV